MDVHHQTKTKYSFKTHLATTPQWRNHWRVVGLRQRKLPTIRLGGKRRRGLFILRMLRRIRVRWSKLQYRSRLRKLKEYYRKVVKDLIDGSASLEGFQQRIFLESAFGVPGLGVSFSAFPSVTSSRASYF